MEHRNDEIEITPEMIEAGLNELITHPISHLNFDVLRSAIKATFKVMTKIACSRDHVSRRADS